MTIAIPPSAPQGGGQGPAIPPAAGVPVPVRLIGDDGAIWALSSAAPIAWELRPGILPYVGNFTTTYDRAEEWLTKTGGGFVTLEWAGRKFRNLRVLRASQYDPLRVTISVADRRHRWRYLAYHGRHNLRRKINDIKLATELVEDLTETQLGPDAKRDDLSGVAQERYRAWSIQADDQPYTAKNLAILIFRALFEELDEDGFDAGAAASLPDNGEIVEQQEYLGQPYIQIIGSLLQKAELSVVVDDDGTVRMFDPYAPLSLPAGRIVGGALRVPSLERVRPAVIEVRTPIERDKRGVYNTAAEEPTEVQRKPKKKADEKPDNTFALHNVLQLPVATTIEGVQRDPGEWVLVKAALDAWSITEDHVRQLWFFGGEGLKMKYARRIKNGKVFYDPVVLRKIHEIVRSYRQIFQIDPAYLDVVREWRPVTVSVINAATRERQKSPVYTQWYDLFPALPLDQRRGPANKVGDNLSSWQGQDDDGNATVLETPVTAPAQIQMIDQALGIFAVSLMPAIDGGVAERIPSNVDKPPQVFDPDARQRLQFFTKNSELAKSHRLEVVISVIEGTPNASEDDPLGGKRPHYVKFYRNTTDEDGAVPKLQLFESRDTARLDEDGKLVNKDQIDALTKGRAIAAAKSYIDRPLGVITVEHDPRTRWKIHAHILGIKFQRSTTGADTVTINAGEPPPEQSATRYLPAPVRNYLFRVVASDKPQPPEE